MFGYYDNFAIPNIHVVTLSDIHCSVATVGYIIFSSARLRKYCIWPNGHVIPNGGVICEAFAFRDIGRGPKNMLFSF